ncbi:MAG: hypothetical protein HXX18_15170, partial [Bacteroidetes bacterium]|nr:hypothetical protein [Bacteroidota bacterium]
QIILDEATSNLGGKYRGLANSLSTSFNFGEQATRVGPFNRKGGYLAYIVDQGTKERSYVDSKTSKKHETGRITPNYWWQRANQSSQNKVEETIYQDLRKSFIEILEKNN